MNLHTVRFTVGESEIAVAEAAIRDLFAAVHRRAPAGLDYLAVRTPDSGDFQMMARFADGANPLLSMPEAQQFRTVLGETLPPPITLMTLGGYGAFGDKAQR